MVEGRRYDGLPCENYRTDRHRTVFELFTDLRNNAKLQITSPPGSGKSSLAALFIRYVIIIQKRNVLYIPCSQLDEVTDEISSHSSFIKHLASKLLHDYDLLLDNPSQNQEEKISQIVEKLNKLLSDDTVVITDDSHRIYKAREFWAFVIKTNPCLLLCALSSQQLASFIHDRTSPTELENKRSLEVMRFRRYEFDELIDKMIEQDAECNRIRYSKRVRDEIFIHTKGFPCLVFRFIQSIIDNFDKLNSDEPSTKKDDSIYNYYFGVRLNRFFTEVKRVASTRCFPSSEEIIHYIESLLKATKNETQIADTRKFAATSLLQRSLHLLIIVESLKASRIYSVSSFTEDEYNLCLKTLARMCICGKERNSNGEDFYFFWNNIYRHVYTEEYMKLPGSIRPVSSEIIDNMLNKDPSKKVEFVHHVVSYFSSSLLKESLSKSVSKLKNHNGKVLEAAYDRIFFFCIRTLGFTSISAQYNQGQNKKGIFDNLYSFWLKFQINLILS